jgi:antirestriction protein ArdC
MARALSVLTDPVQRPDHPASVKALIAALARGDAPWLCPAWLASTGALPPGFAPSGRPDAEEAFHELFAATGMDSCMGASISFYSRFDDRIHLTSWTEAAGQGYYRDWIHELLHATGHASRLGRALPPTFGHNVDHREDLTAEIASAIVCHDLGFAPRLRHPECIPGWIELLGREPAVLREAAVQARDAAAYLFARRDAQAASFERWDAAERERERWGLRCATASRPGERRLAARH